MGSNMQRQAVPLLVTEPPLVATGMETRRRHATRACWSGPDARARSRYVDADAHRDRQRRLSSCASSSGLNERTCQNQKPIVAVGQKVEKGEVIADGAATYQGELALGRNVLVAFMAWDGFNFEDAIIISEELVQERHLHLDPHRRVRHRNPRDEAGPRGVHPRHSQRQRKGAAQSRRERHRARSAPTSSPGDILVGKVSPKSKTELTPEEKLLHAIFGRAGEDVKNDSLEVPSGVEGIVIDTQKFSRRMSLSEDERKEFEKALKEAEAEGNAKIAAAFGEMVERDREACCSEKLTDEDGNAAGRSDQEHQLRGRAGAAVQARRARHPQPAAQGRGREDLQDASGRRSKRRSTTATASSTR